MRILALETSTMLGGAAIAGEEGLIAEVRLNVRATHSERLMPAVDQMLAGAGMTVDDMDAFAVSAGPGSFTGLRIGISTVKGLSFSTGKPVVAVPTLDAFAWNFPYSRHPVCLLLDARKGEVYAAVFEWRETGFLKVFDERAVKPSEVAARTERATLFAGEGALLNMKLLREALGERAVFAPAHLMVPSPAHVAALGLGMALRGEFTEAARLEPLYIRKSEAEVKWMEKHERHDAS